VVRDLVSVDVVVSASSVEVELAVEVGGPDEGGGGSGFVSALLHSQLPAITPASVLAKYVKSPRERSSVPAGHRSHTSMIIASAVFPPTVSVRSCPQSDGLKSWRLRATAYWLLLM